MIYKVVITPDLNQRDWRMAVYSAVPGRPDEVVVHERTDRTYASAEDCCTSARHIIKGLERNRRS